MLRGKEWPTGLGQVAAPRHRFVELAASSNFLRLL